MKKKERQFFGTITSIHQVLAHSYLVYFSAAVLGLVADYFYPYRILSNSMIASGPVLLFIATGLIYWAQHTSQLTAKERESKEMLTAKNFRHGPYALVRSPTHVGLGLLVLGLAFIMNSGVMIVGALLAFLLTRYLYVSREEAILLARYGDAYRHYQKQVQF